MSNKQIGGIFLGLAVLIILGFGAFLLTNNDELKQIGTSSRNKSGGSDQSRSSSTTNNKALITAQEVTNHSTKDDCWTIIRGRVYDLTSYAPKHPGGSEILQSCGKDGTSLFTERSTSSGDSVGSGTPHRINAENDLAKLQIGTLQ